MVDLGMEMEKRPLLKHLFARLNKEVETQRGGIIHGDLSTIDLALGYVEINDRKKGKTYFINLHKVIFIEALGADQIVRQKGRKFHNQYSR